MSAARLFPPQPALLSKISISGSFPVPFSTPPVATQFLLTGRIPRGGRAPFSSSAAHYPYSSQSRFPRYKRGTPKSDRDSQRMPEEETGSIGDCLVFEEGAFEEDLFASDSEGEEEVAAARRRKKRPASTAKASASPENLVPDKWSEVVAEINLSKKEKREISHELRFGSKVERRKLPVFQSEEYLAYKEMKFAQVKPLVLDNPVELPPSPPAPVYENETTWKPSGERAQPRNPKSEVSGESLESISDFFYSENYVPVNKDEDTQRKGPQKLYTKEEKDMLNRRIPDLSIATSRKWLPLHTLAASGDHHLTGMLLKHNVDLNAIDWDGLCAIHKAIIGKKQAILNYLLRESANPFVVDMDGATLMHYAVQTAAIPAIKILLLYDVDINMADNDGWTPLHLAVQGQRTDVVKLLLIKGADKTLKNKDGLTPLDLCFYLGVSERTFELVKLLKLLPREKEHD